MRKFLTLCLFVITTLSLNVACSSSRERSTETATPRSMIGVLRYTGGFFAPIHFDAPYKYALYNSDGQFLAYVDTSKIVTAKLDKYIDAFVILRGSLTTENGEHLFLLENINYKRN